MYLGNNPVYNDSEYTLNNTPDMNDMASFVDEKEVEDSQFQYTWHL